MEHWVQILTACAPILVALVGIIPTVIANRKKTQQSLADMQAVVVKDLNETKADVAGIRQQLDDHVDEYEAHKAKQCRYRILRFYDEVCQGQRHSESHFEDVLEDIDFYESYCEHHPDFRNSRGHAAMDYIKEVYKRIKSRNGFLTHEEEN